MSGNEAHAAYLTKVACLQLAKAAGFEGASQGAIDTLADVVRQYIEQLSQRAHDLAEHGHRCEVSLVDLISSLRHHDVPVASLLDYANSTPTVKFARSEAAEFPVTTLERLPLELRDDPEPLPPHAPAFLPPFPPRHTYISTAVYDDHEADVRQVTRHKTKTKRQAEQSLVHLMRLGSSGRQDHYPANYEAVEARAAAASGASAAAAAELALPGDARRKAKSPWKGPPKPTPLPASDGDPYAFANSVFGPEPAESRGDETLTDADRHRRQQKAERIFRAIDGSHRAEDGGGGGGDDDDPEG